MTTEQIVLDEIKKHIATLPAESQIKITCIAGTFRNCLSIDPEHAGLAMALVGAEQAARG